MSLSVKGFKLSNGNVVRYDYSSLDNIITDSTLSVSGTAADAAAVGNEISEMQSDINNMSTSLETVTQTLINKIDGAYADDEGYLFLTSNGEVVAGPIGPFAGGSGGGGGGSINTASLTVTNTTGWLSKTISSGGSCPISFTWSSVEDEIPTGGGTLKVTVSGTVRATIPINQGDVSLDVSSYLSTGTNSVRCQILDVYGNSRIINFTVVVVALSISSTFDTSIPYTGVISFPYTPVGAVEKTVKFFVDGTQVASNTTSVSGRQLTQIIPAQSHGSHSLRVYFEAEINGEMVTSNELYFEFISSDSSSTAPIITSSFNTSTVEQYSLVAIPYRVYTPSSDTSDVVIKINGTTVSTQTVDRTEQSYSFRANSTGTLTFVIQSGVTTKTITMTVTAVSIDVEAETENLVLHLNAQGRSNNESTRSTWEYENISATLTGFQWAFDGWKTDDEGNSILRFEGDARAEINYKPFANNFIQNGKTLEFEFGTRQVADYSATIMSCMSGNIGFTVTPQSITFKGAQTEISTVFKDNEHLRVSITVGKQGENRLILVYINGIISRAIQYASGERFSQLSPVNITIGSNACGVDIYNIRIYDSDLNSEQVEGNWIADTQDGALMLDRYNRNHVRDEYGNISVETLPSDMQYMIIESASWPQYKGDKKTSSVTYVDPVYPARSFTAEGVQINVQGTSSSVYYMKNIDMQFKKGFVEPSGNTVANYALRPGSIPFNRFVLKADVASIESVNNTGLVMFYNDTCPYKVPEMLVNDKVRWGIEGIPIVMFWRDTSTGNLNFMGKYNMNLPKRCPGPLGYSDNDQSWEVERNNSANVKFQDDDFISESWNELDQQYYPTWYDDWEARFPSDEWRDYSVLKEFITWVKSTNREACTNQTLSSPVSYRLNTTATISAYSSDSSYTVTDETENGVSTGYKIITFTKDTPAYRLTKFRAEFPNYSEVESATYYYLFTEFFLMIDSRAKNMFLGFHGSAINDNNRAMTRKVVYEPYDMDTAMGTNNSGVLMFDPYLEDTDTVSGIIAGVEGSNANVFNAQDSVLWSNFRDAYRAEITNMYRSLRAGTWNYNNIEGRLEAHQAKWSEAIYNEDQFVKHIYPLINPVTVDEETGQLIRTDRYLTMSQGSKKEQRKWWLQGRFRYWDSKTSTGNASSSRITMRLFSSGTLTITPAIDMYVGVYFGGGTNVSLKRTKANTPTSFVYTASAQEMETWIDSGDLITDVGDLSVFYPNELDFSRATRLRRLQIGSNESGYSNTHLTTIDVHNSTLLEYIDLRNCPNLAITVNLEGSPRLEEAYFEGTAITGVDLADGCVIETLHLPGTITTLALTNLNNLTDLTCPSYANVSRLMLTNIDQSIVDPVTILSTIQAGSQVYIQGFQYEMDDAAEIEQFLSLLDTMQGVTREKNANGEWIYHDYDTAQVSGEIHTTSLTGAEIAEFNARYPYIRVTADHTSSILRFYNGTTLLTSQTILDGGNGSYSGSTPTKAQDAQYTYTFAGWSKDSDDNTVDSDALQNVVADRNVYACYTGTLRKYSVYFVKASADGGGTLQTISNVDYGTVVTAASRYTGATPTTTQGSATDYPFKGWEPASATVTGNTTFTAKFDSPVEVAEITDSWDTIIANIDNGTYSTKYKLGNYKPLDLGTEGTINMQIVAIDEDELADGSGTAPLTFLGMELLNTEKNNSPSGTGSTENPKYWGDSSLRTYLQTTIASLVPAVVKARIRGVRKVSAYGRPTTRVLRYSTDSLWIPSIAEINGHNQYWENEGAVYTRIYKDNASRIKQLGGNANSWLTRTEDGGSWRGVSASGGDLGIGYTASSGVCLGFCLGLETETIEDSWETILANENYATDYSIGDTKFLDLGTEGKHLMEIVAFDEDDKADGNGKAGITWISKTLLNTMHRMNATATTEGGWQDSEMRTYLKNTIKPLIPATIRNAIVEVTKVSQTKEAKNGQTTIDDVWIPNRRELNTGYSETTGAKYSLKFTNNTSRIKKNLAGNSSEYWVRSATFASATNYDYYLRSGDIDNNGASAGYNNMYIALGFCTN